MLWSLEIFPVGIPLIDLSQALPKAETDGSIIGGRSNWVTFAQAGGCGIKLMCENRCATGEFATLRLRARARNTTVSGNGNNSVGTITCLDLSASAIQDEYGNLKALNACAQPNAYVQSVDATNIVTAVYGRIDATGASVGRRWVEWIDTHATTKASGGDYMVRISHNGTVALDGCWTIYNGGRLPVLFNFEDAAGFLTDTGDAGSTKAGKIAVQTPAGTKYIQLVTA